jgi:hypothetical protein
LFILKFYVRVGGGGELEQQATGASAALILQPEIRGRIKLMQLRNVDVIILTKNSKAVDQPNGLIGYQIILIE